METTMHYAVNKTLVIGQIDTSGKTVAEVVAFLQQQLRSAEIELEWIDSANFTDDPNQGRYGLPPRALWPLVSGDRTLHVSVSRGQSNAWLVEVAFARWTGTPEHGQWLYTPLVRAKSLTRSAAWSVAASVASILNID